MISVVGVLVLLAAAVLRADEQPQEPEHFAADRPIDCLHMRFELNVDVENKRLAGVARLDIVALREVSSITLDAINFETSKVTLASTAGNAGEKPTAVRFINDGKHIEVLPKTSLKAGEKFSLFIHYTIEDPDTGLRFFGPSENEPDVPYIAWTQGESIFNSNWIPCFDHPNERQTTEMIVTTKRGYEVSSNGRLLSKKENPADDTVTFHWVQDKPHVAYLISLIIGDFEIVRETWRGKSIEYWVRAKYEEQVARTFKNTTRMLDFFSDKIGVEYPWDRYAQLCCYGFGGGMENTAATTLGERSLLDERASLDSSTDGLIAHELAHQWWGDYLTCRDWAHIWLNEGFASYFEALWAEEDLGADEFAYNMYRKASRARRGGKNKPIVDRNYSHPMAMFDSRAYPKGAWVLHMMRRRLGDDLFWEVMNTYATTYALKTVETVDLRKTIEKVSGRSFERFFYDWTERPGHPEVTVSYKWLNDDKLAKVTIKQTQKAVAFHFPLKIEFRFDDDAKPVTVTRDISQKEMTFYHPLAAAPTMFRIDPQQTVLMDLKAKQGRGLWKAQLLDDPSVVARIRAAKYFGESKSTGDRKLLAEALSKEPFWGVQAEIAKALKETGGDVARDALLAGLQFENHKARRACVQALDSFHGDDAVIKAIRPMVINGDPSYRVESAAIETFAALEPEDGFYVLKQVMVRDSRNEVIRNAALRGLGKLRDPEVVPLLAEWTRPDKPRRCRPSAIRALAGVTKRTHVDEATILNIVDTLAAALGDTGRRVRGAAARALGSISEPALARTALPTLEAIAANDPAGRVRRAAERTIKTIQEGKPPQVQMAELRDDLKEALEANEDLAERLEKLESLITEDEEMADQKRADAREGSAVDTP
ncbi:MAG: M1 family aminopeptidase [Planctomycetota bacterium]|nr:M1 family aminopeptidase [Planctomycetota bacterium]